MTSTMVYDTKIKYWGDGLSSRARMPGASRLKERAKMCSRAPHSCSYNLQVFYHLDRVREGDCYRKYNSQERGGNGIVFRSLAYDLEPIELKEFFVERQAFCFRFPFKSLPRRDESGEYLIVEDEYYELFVYAENREILKRELLKEFAMLWDTYVMGDKKLTLRAKQLKEKLQKNIYPKKEATRGAQ